MTLEEIKLRQLTNQHLLTPAGHQTVVRDLCGVQAQFLSNALHAIRIRSNDFSAEDTSGLIKSWTIRGTVHVFSEDDLPLFLHQGRRHKLRPCDTLDGDESVSAERKKYFADLIVENIGAGISTREELKAVCFVHGMSEQEAESIFNAWGGTIRALCENGTISHTVQEKKAFQLCPPFTPMEENAARLEMARRYFTHFGPATIRDAAYFFGTTQTEVKRWLAQLPVTSAVCGSQTYYYIDRNISYSSDIPACIFLAGFDQLLLGYQKTEGLYLSPEHIRGIFNLAGIVMPGVLLHGEVIGSWKKKGRKLLVTTFKTVSPADRMRIEECAGELWPELLSVEMI